MLPCFRWSFETFSVACFKQLLGTLDEFDIAHLWGQRCQSQNLNRNSEKKPFQEKKNEAIRRSYYPSHAYASHKNYNPFKSAFSGEDVAYVSYVFHYQSHVSSPFHCLQNSKLYIPRTSMLFCKLTYMKNFHVTFNLAGQKKLILWKGKDQICYYKKRYISTIPI